MDASIALPIVIASTGAVAATYGMRTYGQNLPGDKELWKAAITAASVTGAGLAYKWHVERSYSKRHPLKSSAPGHH